MATPQITPDTHPMPSDTATHAQIAKPHLLDLSNEDFEQMLAGWGQRPFRARQMRRWSTQHGATSFDAMSDVPEAIRKKCAATLCLDGLVVDQVQRDSNGTRKYRLVATDGSAFEAVYIPEVAKGRGTNTLCISSQTGCAVGCKFCYTASLTRHRNLLVSEIVGQVKAVMADLLPWGEQARVTNIVFMGMGEPLLNYDNVVAATRLLLDKDGFAFPGRRITISTSGIVPRLKTLGRDVPTQLAISLNATTNAQRTEIMPINKKWPLEVLLEALRAYPLLPRRKITIEYVMLGGVNDSPADARRLIQLLGNIPNKINLLPLNPHERTVYTPPSKQAVDAFQKILIQHGFHVFVRTARGQEISAACGQLGDTITSQPPKARSRRLPVIRQSA